MNMVDLCTLFDSAYFTRGLALHRSLVNTAEPFRLYVLCLDESVYSGLTSLALPGVVPITRSEFESPQLLQVKQNRNVAEYCWTCASHLIRYVLEKFDLPIVTYIDADLYFYQKPSLLLEELIVTNSSILLTEHRFSPELMKDIKFGRYCVQFMAFRNDTAARTALDWWCDRTLEWCYSRLEDGKFGDQKYLDDWCQRFEGVCVSSHIGAGVANWNVQQYLINGSATAPTVNGTPVVFFHFHNIRLYLDGRCDLGYKRLSPSVVELFYRPYLTIIREMESDMQIRLGYFDSGRLENRHSLARVASYLLRRPRGIYNVIRSL